MHVFAANVFTAMVALNINIGRHSGGESVSLCEEDKYQCTITLWTTEGACDVLMNDYAYDGFNGEWALTEEYENGAPVYSYSYSGMNWYLWLDSAYGYPGWAIGPETGSLNTFWGWKWGNNLFDDQWWYRDWANQWHRDYDASVTCPAHISSAKAASSGAAEDGAVPTQTDGVGMDSLPPIPDDIDTSSGVVVFTFSESDVRALMAAAAIGAVILVAVFIVVFLKRRNAETKPDVADHVQKVTPKDIVEAIPLI